MTAASVTAARRAPSVATVLGVLGGSGGVGASVLAAAVGLRAASVDRTVVCLDGDRYGGGLDVTFGLEQEPGLRWPDLGAVQGAVDGAALLDRLPSTYGVRVLSFDRQRDVDLAVAPVAEVLHGLRRASDLVLVDLPRPGTALFEAFATSLDSAVLVSGEAVRALAASCASAAALSACCPEVWLTLRSSRRGGFAAAVSQAIDLPLLGLVRDDSTLHADLLRGLPPGSSGRGALVEAADSVLAQLVPTPAMAAS